MSQKKPLRGKSPNRLSIPVATPRNPFALSLVMRRGGAHGPSAAALRRAAKVKLLKGEEE